MKRSIKIGLGSSAVCLIGVVSGFLLFPKIFRDQISEEVSLKPGSDSRALWTRLPFPMEFKIYIFNVTNPEEVQTGSTPVVQEIGPYCYDFWREKVNQVDNELEDSITFNMKTTWFFNKDKSAPLTGEEQIVIPHPFILGLGIKVAETKPGMTGIVNKALGIIYDNQTDLFLRTSAREALFDGFIVKCNREDFAAKAVCIGIKDEGQGVEELEDETLRYSFFGYRNNSATDSFTISRGIRNVQDLGRVLKFRNKDVLNMWTRDDDGEEPKKRKDDSTKPCTKLRGTDSTVFPPFLQPSEGIWSFTADICRSTQAVYEYEGVYRGIPIRRYNATFGDPKTDPETRCYCPKEPKTCPPAGTFDLSPCVGAPITASLPHFFAADPKLLQDVKGLNPDKEKHGIFIDFESITGKPLSARKRMQFNMPLRKVEKLDLLSELSGVLLPMFWVEEGVALNKTYTGMLEDKLFRTLRYVHGFKWTLIILGAFGVLVSVLLYYKDRTSKFTITPVLGNIKNKNTDISTISASGPGRF